MKFLMGTTVIYTQITHQNEDLGTIQFGLYLLHK